MIIMTHSENNDFRDILSSYAAPLEDEGFTDSVLLALQTKQQTLRLLRFSFLASGSFLGGMMAATQAKPAFQMLSTVSIPAEPIWISALAMLFGFVVWATIDNRGISLP